MRQFILLGVIILMVFSCKKAHIIPAPENLIGEDQMVNILYDIQVLNAANGSSPDMIKHNDIVLESYIYEKYQIDSLQLVNSTIYYASKADEMIKIYELVNNRLDTIKKRLEEERKKEVARNDSIRNLKRKQLDTLKNTPIKKISEIDSLNIPR